MSWLFKVDKTGFQRLGSRKGMSILCPFAAYYLRYAVALLNYTSSGVLWRIFSQTRIFAGLLFTGRNSKAAMSGGHYIFPLSKNYKIEGPWLPKDNLRGQKSLGPLKMSLEMAQKVIVPQKKIMSRSFLNSGTLIVIKGANATKIYYPSSPSRHSPCTHKPHL
jgi:hypothetical protein